MRVLVTGATGFVGAHLVKRLLKEGYEVVGLGHDPKPITTLSLLGLDKKITLLYGDICKEKWIRRVLSDYEIDTVFHLAGQTIVKVGLKDPLTTFEVNCLGTATLLNAIRQVEGVEFIHIASTDKVYGAGWNKKENDRLEGWGIYECSKVAEEAVAWSFHKAYGLPIVITRTANIFGEYDLNPRIIPNTIRALKRGERPVIYRNGGKREYIYVEDAVDAYVNLAKHGKKYGGEIFNVGTGEVWGQEIVLKLIEISGLKIEPIYLDSPKVNEIPYQSMDSSKIREVLGWRPKHTVEEGLKLTWNRWRE